MTRLQYSTRISKLFVSVVLVFTYNPPLNGCLPLLFHCRILLRYQLLRATYIQYIQYHQILAWCRYQKLKRIPLKRSFTSASPYQNFCFCRLLGWEREKKKLCMIIYQSNVFYLHTGLDKSEFGECTHAHRKP